MTHREAVGVRKTRFGIWALMVAGALLAAAGAAAADLDAREIIARVDENALWQSARSRSRMIIRQGNRELVKEMISWTDGEGNGLVEFINPADRGTKYLKMGGDLWMYFPDADDLVRISGHMLRQGFMGSDFSYEDAIENVQLLEKYEVELTGASRAARPSVTCWRRRPSRGPK